MDNPTQHEIDAMYDASNVAGQYLETTGKTDLATMTDDEWMGLVESMVTGYCDGIRSRTGYSIRELDNEIPF